jgi:hypothetical protein
LATTSTAASATTANRPTATHGTLLTRLLEQLKPVFDSSVDGVYIFVDDATAACNEKCAKLWGYPTPAEWAKQAPFLDRLVADSDQHTVSQHYQSHIPNLAGPVRFRFKGKKRDGAPVNIETDMIPLSFEGHAIAYHFVRAAK